MAAFQAPITGGIWAPLDILDRGRHRIWRPDFTLPHHGSLVVEYAGMPDIPATQELTELVRWIDTLDRI